MPTPLPVPTPMPMLTPIDHLQLEVVTITQICILEAGHGSLLSSRPRTGGQCKIAGWQYMVFVWNSTTSNLETPILSFWFGHKMDLRDSVL